MTELKDGGCLEECLGIVLGAPDSEFPFSADPDWLEKVNEFLIKNHSVYLVPINFESVKNNNPEFLKGILIGVYENADGRTPAERTHAVLLRAGKIVVDPSHGRWFEVPGRKELSHFLLVVFYYNH